MRAAYYLGYHPQNIDYLSLAEAKREIAGGREVVSTSLVVPYPPGFPVLVPGQVISPEILEVMRYVCENLDCNYMLEDLAARVALSVSRFKVRFKEEVGVPPADYVARQKVSKAMDLLRKTGMPITQIATSLGYSSSQYFATAFRRYTGKTPSQARREAYPSHQPA